jgi:transposase
MRIRREQFALIEHLLPVQRGNVSIDKHTLLNAIFHVAVSGCTSRGLPAESGRWHTAYTRMRRWARAGVLARVFEELRMLQLLNVRIEVVSFDSMGIKVHPDGAGALNEGAREPSVAAAGGSTPRFIWLPRAASGSSVSA